MALIRALLIGEKSGDMKGMYYLLALISFLIVSCTQKSNCQMENVFRAERIKSYTLDSVFYGPREIHCTDSFIIIHDYNAEKMYSVFQKGNMHRIFSFGSKGDGPNDYIFPESLKSNATGFYIFDRSIGKINELTLFPDKEPIHSYVKRSASFLGLNNLIQTNDSSYVALSYSDDYRYVIVKNDSLFPSLIDYPDDGIMSSKVQKSMSYQGRLVKHPHDDKFVFVSFYGRIMEILQLTGSKELDIVFSSYKIFPQYIPAEGGVANVTDDNTTGVLAVSVSERYIYLLYSGKKRKEKNRNFSNRIEVYDWEGAFIRCIMTDEELSGFCVDSDNVVYGLSYNEDNMDDDCKLMVYDITCKE